MSFLINCFLLGITLCAMVTANNAPSLINQTIVIEVDVDLPWFIKFKIPLFEHFEPQVFSVNINRPGAARARPVGFNAYNETVEKRRIFRNSQPLRLYEGDIIYGQLGYMGDLRKRREETELKHVDFSYVINKKQFDTIPIVVEVLTDSNTNQAEDYEEYEIEDATATNTINGNTNTNTADKCASAVDTIKSATNTVPCNSFVIENGYTVELLKTALQIGQIGTRLLCRGNNRSHGTNAVDDIKTIIMDRLHLPHLTEKVLQAQYISTGLLFEMATPHDKLEVLTKARLCLNKKLRIDSTELNFAQTQH